jgi:predicted phage tail protein
MTDKNKLIKGSGGLFAPKPPAPYRAPDTLHSRSFATIQDLFSEGEIEGFATASKEGRTKGTAAYLQAAKKDVFIDDTPVLKASADSTNPQETDFNFAEVGFDTRFGTNNQTRLPGIPAETRSPSAVNVTVTTSSPVTRQVTNTDVDAVVITLTWPAIQIFEDDGDIRGDTVEYKIQVQYNSGGYTDVITPDNGGSVSGRTADAYARDHRINIDGAFPVDFRVVRVTADSTSNERVNAFEFTSIQEVIDTASTYPDSAYCALRLDSKQFNSIPTRKYRLRGIKVKIPGAGASGTGTPTVDNETGRIIYPSGYIFNGVMGAAVYTNCPAMCLLDLLTNTRYGLGEHITESNLDLFSFVAASKYANTLVSDLAGGFEARFSCNVNIQSPKEAFAAINELAGVMRCMPIWSAGSITITQDKDTFASYLFNLSNVGVEGFNYQGTSLKQRHAVISVSYFNMDSREIDFEIVGDDGTTEDNLRQQKYGSAIKQVKAFACTSRAQAQRLGRAILFAEQNESETVTFSTSIDAGVVVRPGAVIEINDPVRAGARRGGRVISATTTTITIDASSDTLMPSISDTPEISVVLEDGTVEIGTISNISGAVITVNSVKKVDTEGVQVTQSTFSSAPIANSPYLISSSSLQTQLFRVISVVEEDDVGYVITALSYVANKYAFIESGATLATRTVSLLTALKDPPTNLVAEEKIVVLNNVARTKLIVTWEPVEGVSQYLVSYRLESGNFVSVVVFSNDFELLDTPPGTYTIQVYSYNLLSRLSLRPKEIEFIARGKTDLPNAVSGLTIEPINEQFVRLRFNQSTETDVLHGGRVYIRHTNRTGAAAKFEASQDIIEAIAGNSTDAIVPALAGTYLVKFQDDGGRFSADTTSVSLSLVDILDSILVKTDREDTKSPTPFPGNKTNTVLLSGALKLTDPTTQPLGEYDFQNILDLESVFTLTLKRHFQSIAFFLGGDIVTAVYAQTGTTVTITSNSHGRAVGNTIIFDATSGAGVDGTYIITSISTNTFTFTSGTSQTVTTSNCTFQFINTFEALIPDTGPEFGGPPNGGLDGYAQDGNFDGAAAQNTNAQLLVATTSAAPSNGSSYQASDFNGIDFNVFANGAFKARGFKFKIKLNTDVSSQNISIEEAGYTATMPVRTEQSAKIDSGLGAKTVPFASPFFVGATGITNIPKPSVTISPQNMASGDFYELLDSNITGTQFIVHFKDSNGANVNRSFTYNAVGFGKGG